MILRPLIVHARRITKRFSLDVTNLDIIWGWILSIPPLVIPLWVTYRKWRGRPEFETVHLDTSFWAINLILYLVVITILITLLVLKPITGVIKFIDGWFVYFRLYHFGHGGGGVAMEECKGGPLL